MGNLFSKKEHKKESRVTEQDKAILQLKQQRDKLKQYQKKINERIGKDREVAKALLKDGKKEKAKLLLRKKKFQETLLEKTDGQLENIERMVNDLEFAQIESQVVQGLKTGNESLKKLHRLMSLEDVEKIMDETRESIDYQRQNLPEVPRDELPELPEEKQREKAAKKAKREQEPEAMLAS
ncbi:hypothetical protein KUTeg_003756 [Tegillarca granosa]|uniref:Charged multivesicular body protein 6 n=1 Tax=Tegillarca granosa TaxID=220873 RepID=A0ABQ9FN22_TEGGR|nr:hypothetical protein KUTeg_003756 [Tegillarca granosa]